MPYGTPSSLFRSLFRISIDELFNEDWCNYHQVLSPTSAEADRIEFERRYKSNLEVTEILAKANTVYTFYKNVTDRIYFLGLEKSNFSSNSAKFTLSLSTADGATATETVTYKLMQEHFKEFQNNTAQDEETKNSDEPESDWFEYLLDFFNVLSIKSDIIDPDLYKSLEFNVDKIFELSALDSLTINGEVISQHFSYQDYVY